jgi:hypothetical protein
VTRGLLDRSRIVARPGWSRWLVPPAALSIHLAIGSVYAWSVFKIPLEKSLHISGTASALPFTIGIVMLGLSAAVLGTRVDHKGPRWAMFVATVCFCSGLLIAADPKHHEPTSPDDDLLARDAVPLKQAEKQP